MEKIVLNNEYFLYRANSNKFIIFVHGMVETCEGYHKIKDFLVQNDYNVILYNQRGHGKNSRHFGHLNKGDSLNMINDVIEIEEYLKSKLEAMEVTIVAHSMGTAVVRAAMNKHEFDRVVLNGMPDYITNLTYNLVSLVFKILPNNKPTRLFDKVVFKSYDRKIKYGTSWVCTNDDYMNYYNSDPYSGNIATTNFYVELFNIFRLSRPVSVKSTKMLLTTGLGDPVSKFGKVCHKAKEQYSSFGCDVELIEYENMNHFIYDETNCEVCYKDLLQFIEE